MAGRRPSSPKPRRKAAPPARSVRQLERALAEARETLEAERQRHARQLEAARRKADRQLASVVREIAALRHHQARAEDLARRLADCEARREAGREPPATTAATIPLTRDPDGEEPLGGGSGQGNR